VHIIHLHYHVKLQLEDDTTLGKLVDMILVVAQALILLFGTNA